MKIIKACRYCGKIYYVNKGQENRSKFCSDECFRKNKNTQLDYDCDYCGKTFKVIKSKYENAVKNNKKLFCSSQCAKDIQKPKWEDIVTLFEGRGYILLSDKYVNAKEKLIYICLKHQSYGELSITYNNLKYGFGCPYCGRERTVNAKRVSFEYAKEVFAKNDMELLDQPYTNSSTPMAYICKNHRDIGIQYKALVNAFKQHCPYCHKIKGEAEIARILQLNNVDFSSHKSYDDLRGVGGGKLSYDFYLPKYDTLIEFQGEQHERPIDYFGGEEQFKIQCEHDLRKRNYAIEHNTKLLEIWYYEFNNIESILKKYFSII